MKSSKVTLITTVLNEEQSVRAFIDSIFSQTLVPDEVIIVDGGSTDKTLVMIKEKINSYKNKLNIKVLIKKGNRSVGRNEAIKNSLSEIILCTDSGCVLDKNWVKEISKQFRNKDTEVVAGYYKGKASTVFEKCLVPYVLVMSDKVSPAEFLPATRSMAFRKSVWKKNGKFDEKLSHNEDYVFASKLKENNVKIVFVKKAIVNWIPKGNLLQAFTMFLRFAFGDSESAILRDKVLLISTRYTLYLYLIILTFLLKSLLLLIFLIFLPVLYLMWSINKNYRYIKNVKAFFILPVLQITSDLAVLMGTSLGYIKYLFKVDYKTMLKENITLITLLIIYVITMLFVIKSGIPNQNHPFPYQMDEWHQLQAVRSVFRFGTPNIEGSANGSMFHFFVSGILLVPFYLLKIIDPFIIKSAVDSLYEQEKLFIVLRLITLFFGVLTLVVVSKIARLLKVNYSLAVLLFFVTPVWLSLSNFFKYDIALVFWIVLSLYFLIKYYFSPTQKDFILGSFFAGIAFSVKVTGVALLPIIILAYFLFTPNFNKKYFVLFSGLTVFAIISVFFGIPDLIFGGKSLYRYLYENLILLPNQTATNIKLNDSLFNITFFHKMPIIFGHMFFYFSIFSAFFLLASSFRNFVKKNYINLNLKIFLFISLAVFIVSLSSLNIGISANRALVLLPFIVIINLLAFNDIYSFIKNNLTFKKIILGLFFLLFSIQIFESYLWVALKVSTLPQEASSKWIIKNIPKHTNIGLENVPIYQFEPDYILKDFYYQQYDSNYKNYYNYHIVDTYSKNLPEYIILSNVNYEQKYYKFSNKNNLVARLKKEKYHKIAYFTWEFSLYGIFDNYFYYPFLGLYAYPEGISVYKK